MLGSNNYEDADVQLTKRQHALDTTTTITTTTNIAATTTTFIKTTTKVEDIKVKISVNIKEEFEPNQTHNVNTGCRKGRTSKILRAA